MSKASTSPDRCVFTFWLTTTRRSPSMTIPFGPSRPLVENPASSVPVATSNRLTVLSPASPMYRTSARAGWVADAATSAAATRVGNHYKNLIVILLFMSRSAYNKTGRVPLRRPSGAGPRTRNTRVGWAAEGSVCRRDLSGFFCFVVSSDC